MFKIFRLLATLGMFKLAARSLGAVRSSSRAPRPLKWGATAALAFLALRR